MGANAQTTVQKFLSGAVLTAEQQNFSAATGVPVFATTVTRDAAFGGANKVLAEGQTCYLEDANVVQYYDGAAWATVGPTAAPTSGLVVVRVETAFTTANTITADSIFTSSYTNYKLLLTLTPSAAIDLTYQNRVGGVTATTNYSQQRLRGTGSSVSASGASGGSFGLIMNADTTTRQSEEITIYSPQLAAATNIYAASSEGHVGIGSFNVFHTTATAYDGFILTASGGNTMTGTYTIYGYGKTL